MKHPLVRRVLFGFHFQLRNLCGAESPLDTHQQDHAKKFPLLGLRFLLHTMPVLFPFFLFLRLSPSSSQRATNNNKHNVNINFEGLTMPMS
ncbi:transmembrane protein, putative [Bodo saltans]|uniref:Transmembrane protein, putative n=1 Tax=Bodo saltans TaxID=75058 RepID=A0A0S4JI42_BODSA|nr:transmembrane protein, putative [Bodo saltans]|eukprot:CUG89804.1 transmembrane protein, putative [Bodo saltans]